MNLIQNIIKHIFFRKSPKCYKINRLWTKMLQKRVYELKATIIKSWWLFEPKILNFIRRTNQDTFFEIKRMHIILLYIKYSIGNNTRIWDNIYLLRFCGIFVCWFEIRFLKILLLILQWEMYPPINKRENINSIPSV